eukprot:7102023-Karenia_brevis.AAC.1
MQIQKQQLFNNTNTRLVGFVKERQLCPHIFFAIKAWDHDEKDDSYVLSVLNSNRFLLNDEQSDHLNKTTDQHYFIGAHDSNLVRVLKPQVYSL